MPKSIFTQALAVGLLCVPGAAFAQETTVGGAAAGAVTGAVVGGPVGAVVGGLAGGALGTAFEREPVDPMMAQPRPVDPRLVRPRAPAGRFTREMVMNDPVLARKWQSCTNLYPSFDPRTGTFIGRDGLVHVCQ